MLTLRKFDYSLQLTLSILMLLSIPVLFIYGFLAGLFLMGFWQLLSASLNTRCFIENGHTKPIATYWKWTGIVMALLFLCYPLSLFFDPDDVQVIAGVAIVAAVPVAWYYQVIYKKLIDTLKLRQELSGLIK